MTNEVDISVIIPVYNEEKSLKELYNRLVMAIEPISRNYELIFINDGSKDNSIQCLGELSSLDSRVYFIDFSRNFGHQIAVSAGLDFCRGNAVVIIDSDLQDPPELIPTMYSKYLEGFDVVYAKRAKRLGESFFKRITAVLFYRILAKITSIEIPLDTGDFRLIDRKIVDCLRKMPEQNKFLRGQIAWLGFSQTSVEFVRNERKHGETGYPFNKMLKFALDGVTAFSDAPLKLVTQSGIVFSIFSLLAILYVLYGKFFLGHVINGWTSLIISVLFFGGIQLISIGVIGLYVSRINRNIIARPLYLIKNTNIP